MRRRVYRNQLFIGLLGRFIVAPRLSALFRLLSLAPFAKSAQTIIYPDSHHQRPSARRGSRIWLRFQILRGAFLVRKATTVERLRDFLFSS
jgi:hypothetical protein